MGEVDGFQVGGRVGPFDTTVDARFGRRYAEATGAVGAALPPLAVATRIFEAQFAAFEALVPAPIRAAARGGVHGEQDVVLHRPIRAGEKLSTTVEAHSAHPFRDNVRLVLRHLTVDAEDRPVAEQLWTTVLLGVTCRAVGPPTPDHAFPEAVRGRPADATSHARVDAATARRYAEVSGDWSAHHFELEAARRSGFDSVFLHGLCTMGICANAAVADLLGGDPTRVSRVAVRFAAPAFLGHDLTVRFHRVGPDAYAFEADCAGAKVMTHGRIETRGSRDPRGRSGDGPDSARSARS